ncbi:MAG: hypothetical protein P8X94_09260 [Woeseiaceae bacterium]
MANSIKAEHVETDLVQWLVAALERHMPSRQVQLALVSRFGLTDDEALIAERQAIDGILRAISGSKRNMPDASSNEIGHAAFELIWEAFNQNSFFDKRRTPNRKWLDWKEEQTYLQLD